MNPEDVRIIKQARKIIIVCALIVFGIILFFNSIVRIPVGYKGIATRFGAVTGNLRGEGMHFKLPFVDGNLNIETRVQKVEANASAASKDLQTVNSVIAINYALVPEQVVSLYQNVGIEYDARLIQPAIQESVKSVTALFTAEQLITKRGEVSDQILSELVNRLGAYGILVSDLNIVDFDFSKSFNEAIENKVTAEQNALAAKNKLEQIKFEAEQAIASSKGKAEAQRIEGDALRANPEVIELRAIEKWNGQLPQYMTGVTPFVNLTK